MNPPTYETSGAEKGLPPTAPYPQGPTGPPAIGFVAPGTQPPHPMAAQPSALPGPPQVPQAGTQAVVVTQQPAPVVEVRLALPPSSSRYECPSCKEDILTRVEYKEGTQTHIIALLLCLFGCWCCVCIPYCRDNCKNAHHYCPHCGAYIGVSVRR